MISLSHWGMFDARVISYELFPLLWGNGLDTEFYLHDYVRVKW